MEKKDTGKYILIMSSGVLWGTIGLFIKLLTAEGSSPEYTTFMRMFFAFLMLFAITLIKEGIGAFRIRRRMMISCMLLGFISTSLNNLFYTNAVNRLGMSLAVAMLYMSPLFTAIQSKLLFGEKIGRHKLAALALNVAGCALAATGGNFSGTSLSIAGLLFGLGAAFAYSTQNIFGRMATDEGSPFVVATYNFFFATVFTLVLARPFSTVSDPLRPRMLLYGILFALIPTTIAYLIYFSGIQGLKETSKVPVLCSVELISATIIGVLFFHEAYPALSMAGTAMIFISILLMSRAKPE
jgi:drug/metabolite transporter (DMT)-like permease